MLSTSGNAVVMRRMRTRKFFRRLCKTRFIQNVAHEKAEQAGGMITGNIRLLRNMRVRKILESIKIAQNAKRVQFTRNAHRVKM